MYNLHEFALDCDFVFHISTHRDLSIFLYDDAVLNIFKSLLTADSPVQQLSYDTTFNLGDFYLSVLLFRETEFNELPVCGVMCVVNKMQSDLTALLVPRIV
jgi:hypothetical protein